MEQITKYFNAEKNESILFILVGIISIILSIYILAKVKQPFYNGMAYPLITIALIQLIVGGSVYLRSPKDIIRLENILQVEKSKIQTEEIPRMQAVMKNFALYKWLEISLIVVGIIMFFYFQPTSILRGIGLGLFIQAGFMLLLDFFAESRGRIYLEYLQTLI
jgi:multidrug transporter EmrE-like cation transporter